MRYVILTIFSIIVVLCVATLAGCTGSVRHNSRTLTCLGFCNEVEVVHKTDKPIYDNPPAAKAVNNPESAP